MSRSMTVRFQVLLGAVEVVERDPVVLAAVACEDLVVAIAIDVGNPEGVAVGERVVQDDSWAELERSGIVAAAVPGIAGCHAYGHLVAVPGLDGGEEFASAGQLAQVDLARAAFRSRARLQPGVRAKNPLDLASKENDASVVGGQDVGDSVAVGVDDLDGVHHLASGHDAIAPYVGAPASALAEDMQFGGAAVTGRLGVPPEDRSDHQVELAIAVDIAPAQAVDAADIREPSERPGDRRQSGPAWPVRACPSWARSSQTRRRSRSRPCRRHRGRRSRSR